MEPTHIEHPLEPVFDARSRVLVLGTMPSPKSREAGFYYAHPQNRFWKVMGALFGEPEPLGNEARTSFMLERRIALWDVIASCSIEGSSDSSIRDVVPNDLSVILSTADIRAIFCNGKTSWNYYRKYQEAVTGIPAVSLPSTSPANAAWSLEKLKGAWNVILPYIR